MPSTSAASSSSSGTSVPVHPSLASAPTSTSQAGNAAEVIPQHPLQPMLKSIIDELRRTYHEEVLGKVLGGDALHAQKLQKGMKFAKRKLTDIRSEERRRLFGVNPCDAFPALQTKDFAQRYMTACQVSLEFLDIYIKNLAVLRVFVRTVGYSKAKHNTYTEFNKWLDDVFKGEPTDDELEDIARHDSEFNYRDAAQPPASAAPATTITSRDDETSQ
eukprot:Em0019g888a